MKKVQMMMMATATGLFLSACGGSPATEEAVSDETTNSETKTESVETTYTIDPGSSSITWSGTMLGMQTHVGTVDITSGTITVKDGEVTGGKVEVDMTSIAPTDDNYGEDNPKEKLVGHLSSADFFDIENHPTSSISFSDLSGETATAQLSVRGVTNDEELQDLKVKESDGSFEGKTTLTFDRTKYNVSFEMPMKDMVISNDIELIVHLVGNSE